MHEDDFNFKHMLLSLMVFKNIKFNFSSIFRLESSLYPDDSTNIREKVTDLITNQLKYPLHIVSIDEDNDFKQLLFERTKSLTAREELVRRRKYIFKNF